MRKFKKLQALMFENEIRQADMARILHCSPTYLTSRFSAKLPFTMNDVYVMCDTLDIDYTNIKEYFPKNGVPTENVSNES